ncbi:chondroitinase family polysaccharide lyase [Flammeovirga aprica]|uniref:Uncharacterized protein n=1 Tax=Flammeovirga aprica JL-4 TaxID=694437 RepID=A0A7X9RT40_9BACT|nr:chondroitinase family polysaccharide lyase [Flammeovirga aprica]NME66767.1 hypothetical protein [Flammeovirga aprica JL-4]
MNKINVKLYTTFILVFVLLTGTINANPDTEAIKEKLIKWKVGNSSLTSEPFYDYQLQNVLAKVDKVKKQIDKELKKEVLFKISELKNGSNRKAQVRIRKFISAVYVFAQVYKLPSSETILNPYYNNQAFLDYIIATFDYMNRNGWKAGVNLHTMKVEGDQILAIWKELDELGFVGLGGTIYNQASSYVDAVLILENELKKSNRYSREFEMVKWVARIWFPEINGITHPGFQFKGFNSDGFRKLTRLYLPYILLEPDREKQNVHMQHFLRYMKKCISYAPGWADTFKPDGSGYHHKMSYMAAYSSSTYQDAALLLYLLKGTEYSLSPKSIAVIENAFDKLIYFAPNNKIHLGLTGRFPNNYTFLENFSPYYYLMYQATGKIKYLETFKHIYSQINSKEKLSFKYIGEAMSFNKGVREQGKTLDLGNYNTFFPYSGTSIHYYNDVSVSLKGQSKYIKYGEVAGIKQNNHGHHFSSGALFVFGKNNHTGFSPKGWDYTKIPGVTNYNISLENQGKKEPYYSKEYVLGGVNLKNNGLFAVKHQGLNDFGVQGNISVFMFDDLVIALGSNFSGKFEKQKLQTTLFQSSLLVKNGKLSFNGKKPIALQENKSNTWVTLNDGNSYFIPNGNVKMTYGEQTFAGDRGGQLKKGRFATAWIEHELGKDLGYEFIILLDDKDSKIIKMSKNKDQYYKVLQKNKTAHIVQYKTSLGYAFFQAGEGLNHILSVDEACMIMTEEDDHKLHLVATNPDLGWIPKNETLSYSQIKSMQHLYTESTTQNLQITLKGEWYLSVNNSNVKISYKEGNTLLDLEVLDAATVDMTLIKK